MLVSMLAWGFVGVYFFADNYHGIHAICMAKIASKLYSGPVGEYLER